MRQIITSFILAAIATTTFAAQPAQWANKYPFDKIEGKTIFQTQEFKTILGKMPVSLQNKIVKQYSTTSDIKKSGSSILVTGCMPHMCNTAGYIFIYNTKSKEYWVLVDAMNASYDYEKTYCYSSSPNLSSMPIAFYNELKQYEGEEYLNRYMEGKVCK
ncbi:hypothetical protein [Acinetobacter baumannii]|uniref:hypothetical protein n=1 Tax=Acinetobacter baumannii TaxID=470 RepID=UPI0038927577|nr:hypothetical protein [Acinetobacter baumannii]